MMQLKKKLISKIKIGNKKISIIPKNLIIKPQKKISWMSTHTGACYAEILDKKNYKAKIYISGRDKDNKSRIGTAIISFKTKKPEIIKINKLPILDISENIGYFDTDGVLYPEILKIKKNKYLYYCGWLNTKSFNYTCNIGLAAEKKGRFKKVSKSPLFNLNDVDPIGTASFSIIKINKKYIMYYTSFDPWKIKKGKLEHNYFIKIATSSDGLNWRRDGKIALGLKKNEIAVAKPSVFKLNGKICIFFSARKKNYSIFFAQSSDGIKFKRLQKKLNLASGRWSSKSQCYPAYIDFKDKKFLLYCGNNYGKSGIGYAEIKLTNI